MAKRDDSQREGRSVRSTLPVAVGIAVSTWLALLLLVVQLWDDFVEATGDTLDECDRGRCGALGEFTSEHPALLFVLLAIAAALPAAGAGWLLARRAHALRD